MIIKNGEYCVLKLKKEPDSMRVSRCRLGLQVGTYHRHRRHAAIFSQNFASTRWQIYKLRHFYFVEAYEFVVGVKRHTCVSVQTKSAATKILAMDVPVLFLKNKIVTCSIKMIS